MPSSVPIFRPPHEVTIQRCALAHPHHVHAPSTIFPCFVVIASQLCRLFSFNRSKIENIPNRGAAFDSLPSTWKLLRVSCPSRFDPDDLIDHRPFYCAFRSWIHLLLFFTYLSIEMKIIRSFVWKSISIFHLKIDSSRVLGRVYIYINNVNDSSITRRKRSRD